jgi:hypothetical protein
MVRHMPSDPSPAAAETRRGYIRFSAAVAREVCARIAAGQNQREICADAHMPCTATLRVWVKRYAGFAQAYTRARAVGGLGMGRRSTFCPVTAQQIVARISEGETLTSISADPAMPPLRTIFDWRRADPDFGEAFAVAREAAAERLTDHGWDLAMEATTATAYLTHVRLLQLRWMTMSLSPRTHGRLKPMEPPTPPDHTNVTLTTFQTEVHPETGQVRGVALYFDPDTGETVRTPRGEWKDPAFPLLRQVDYVAAATAREEQGLSSCENMGSWDWRRSSYLADGRMKPEAERYRGDEGGGV